MFLKKKNNNIKQRYNFSINEVKYTFFKFLFLALRFKFLFFKFKATIIKNEIYNMCIYSSKSYSIKRKFKVSRIILKEKADLGIFFGLKIAS